MFWIIIVPYYMFFIMKMMVFGLSLGMKNVKIVIIGLFL